MGSFDVPLDDERTQLDTFVEEYRSALDVTLNGLTEDQARRRLVASETSTAASVRQVAPTWHRDTVTAARDQPTVAALIDRSAPVVAQGCIRKRRADAERR